MCGIVGYIGKRKALPILLNGLKRLEYRGYDSAGIAVIQQDNSIWFQKREGKISQLEQAIGEDVPESTIGIGHTRWATHGPPTRENAHPHHSCKGDISLVHNGIIENYSQLKTSLKVGNHSYTSQTDTEVLAHLIESFYKDDITQAVRQALQLIEGTFGILVISANEPDKIVAARRGSPLVIGIGKDEVFMASDGSALVEHTRQVVYLEDDEMAVITVAGADIRTLQNKQISRDLEELPFDSSQIQKEGYEHFMLKEVFEQPKTMFDSMRGRLLLDDATAKLGGLEGYWERISKSSRLIITACGTSWHAALIGEYLIENLAHIPVEVEYASEFRYRNPIVNENDTVLAISQSGETADTLAAIREAKRKGALTLGLCNVVGSTIARETDAGVYLHAGPEIGVASTKAFTSQVVVLTLIALALGRMKNLSAEQGQLIAQSLQAIPEYCQKLLGSVDQIKMIAKKLATHKNALYLGRGYNYPVALEGALKMKEISYIHAEGYPAAEMKHGPIALIDEEMPVILVAVKDPVYEKVVNNIEVVKARGGWLIAVVSEGDTIVKELADHVIEVPHITQCLTPLLTVIPLQLLAYYTAIEKGCDVDQPRNLAKSVTVE